MGPNAHNGRRNIMNVSQAIAAHLEQGNLNPFLATLRNTASSAHFEKLSKKDIKFLKAFAKALSNEDYKVDFCKVSLGFFTKLSGISVKSNNEEEKESPLDIFLDSYFVHVLNGALEKAADLYDNNKVLEFSLDAKELNGKELYHYLSTALKIMQFIENDNKFLNGKWIISQHNSCIEIKIKNIQAPIIEQKDEE